MNDPKPSSPDQKLDRLLQTWSDAQSPTPEQLSELERRVCTGLGAAGAEPFPVQALGATGDRRFSTTSIIGLLSLAAGLLLCLALWNRFAFLQPGPSRLELGQGQSLHQENSSRSERDTIQVSSPADFAHQKALVEKLQSAYDQSLVWSAETGDALHVELDQSEAYGNAQAKPTLVLVRLVVERQTSQPDTAGGHAEPPLWQIDLAVRNEQTVDLTDTAKQGQHLMVWPSVTADGLVLIDTRYDSLGPFKASGNQTHLVRPGTRTRLSNLDEHFALWQYVEVIRSSAHSKT